jgi:hypothetical protein
MQINIKGEKEVLYQIIDFGLAIKLQPGTDVFQRGDFGTLPYYKNSIFETRRSVLYDWHCMYIELLGLLNIVDIGKNSSGECVHTGIGSDLLSDKNVNHSYGITNFSKYNSELRKYLYNNIMGYINNKYASVIFLNILLLLSYAQYIARETSLRSFNFVVPIYEFNEEQGGKPKRIYSIIKSITEYETLLENEIAKLP